MKKKILVAPLHWGLGHATRCVAIIKALENHGFEPVLASDGAALVLLQKEFPHLLALELPSYHIEYPKNGWFFRVKMLQNLPKIIKAVWLEKKLVRQWIADFGIKGIISDNRFGVYNSQIPSVYVTHQLWVFSGITSCLSSFLHQIFIKKFKQIWVPDFEKAPCLSGKMGHLKKTSLSIRYLGILSRFEKEILPIKTDVLVLISGPEPQRSLFENKMMSSFLNSKVDVVLVRGIIEETQTKTVRNNLTIYNFMTSDELQTTINSSNMVICRSGYSSIMDLIQLEKKAFLIPTPGQYEQEFLAKKMQRDGVFPYISQSNFDFKKWVEIDQFSIYKNQKTAVDWAVLFRVFE